MLPAVTAALLAALGTPTQSPPPPPPFHVGEALEYGGSYKFLLVPVPVSKAAVLSVTGIDTLRGEPCWRFSFITDVSALGYHNHSELLSWTTMNDFTSLRFVHRVDESHPGGSFSRHDDFGIYPDSGFFRNVGDVSPRKTPEHPLDDIAFVYYLRLLSTPLQVGKTYRINRYFRADRNPVIINVVGREPCDLPDDARSTCLVLNPVVEDPPHGMFMKDQNARMWITDDGRRLPVKIKSGPLTLTLRKITY